jgi:hypothetical protein
MKRWEYKTVKIKSKSIMKQIQNQANVDGWKIDSVKLQGNDMVAIFKKEKDIEKCRLVER